PWGLASSPGHPFWVANHHTGTATLYDQTGTPIPLVVSIPGPDGTAQGAPTGEIFNGTPAFNGDFFLWATEDGTIAGWKGGPAATIEVDRSGAGAIYKGLASASIPGGMRLYAAD